jgi:hypothetical protein
MILVDTSIWIDHFRRKDPRLSDLLEAVEIVTHPFIIGEIALGSIKDRRRILSALANLPFVTAATDEEALAFIEAQSLAGSGVGYLDAHLLASARLTPETRLWTRDKKLGVAAERLGLAAE